MEEARTCALQFPRSECNRDFRVRFIQGGRVNGKQRIGIRICVGTVECIPVGTSKRSARQRTSGGRRVDFPRGFSSETDPAGVGVVKTSAVIDEESDSLIKINYGAAVICIRLSCLRIS